jgi:hypothetical protein
MSTSTLMNSAWNQERSTPLETNKQTMTNSTAMVFALFTRQHQRPSITGVSTGHHISITWVSWWYQPKSEPRKLLETPCGLPLTRFDAGLILGCCCMMEIRPWIQEWANLGFHAWTMGAAHFLHKSPFPALRLFIDVALSRYCVTYWNPSLQCTCA